MLHDNGHLHYIAHYGVLVEELRIMGCTARVEFKSSCACGNEAPRQRASVLVLSGTQRVLLVSMGKVLTWYSRLRRASQRLPVRR